MSQDLRKVPPQSLEVEQAVLGAIMLEKEAMDRARVLEPESFYKEAHSQIFVAMIELSQRGESIDLITMAEELKRLKKLDAIGGQVYLVDLVENVISTANLEQHCRILQEKATMRKLIQSVTITLQDSYDGEKLPGEVLEEIEKKVYQLRIGQIRKDFTSVKSELGPVVADMLKTGEGGLTGVPTGFTKLDSMTSGLQKGELIIVAGRPSSGKTSFALSILLNVALGPKIPVGIFSLEMSTVSLVRRMICAQARINMNQLANGNLPNRDYQKIPLAAGPLSEAPIFIDDTAGMKIEDMRTKARRLRSTHGLGLLVVDYLQLMSIYGKVQSRENEISMISRSLKELAKDLDIPIIALSQLSRASEKREDRRPRLSDLRESGAIEQDADVVIFIHREKEEITEIVLGKQRNGPTGEFPITFIEKYAKFENYSSQVEEAVF